MNLKLIVDFDTCLKYVKSFGFSNDITWICELCDRINFSSGNKSWFWKDFKPFEIRYNRKAKRFDIRNKSGQCSSIFVFLYGM